MGRAADHARRVPFAGTTIPVLGSTEPTVFKMMYSRGKDWVDIEAMLEAHTVDVDAVNATFVRIMGTDHEALKRFVEMADTTALDESRRDDALRGDGQREVP